MPTVRSRIVCRAPSRETVTMWTSALPYWFVPSRVAMPGIMPDPVHPVS